MKQLIISFFCIMLVSTISVAQSSWKSPEYKPELYRKVIVLAKVSDDLIKRQLEDGTVKMLNDKGFSAIPAYSNISESDLVSEDALIAKADKLEADALIVYTITGNSTEYKKTPSVDASLGIPVKLGIFRGFIGGNVPIAGGTKTVSTLHATATFYNRSTTSMQWSMALNGSLKKGSNKLADAFAKSTVNQLIKDKIFTQ